jgi:hypothetical protein
MGKEREITITHKDGNNANTVLAPVIRFMPPYRVGKKQMRAVLDANGKEIVVFPKGLEHMALEYSYYLNRIHPNGC